jgi:hypothetical protein
VASKPAFSATFCLPPDFPQVFTKRDLSGKDSFAETVLSRAEFSPMIQLKSRIPGLQSFGISWVW